MDTSLLEKAVNQYIEAFAKADITIIQSLFAENATIEDPVGSPVRQGMAAIVEFYQGAFAMGAKLQLQGQPRYAGNSVAFSFDVVIDKLTISPIDVFELNNEGKVLSMKAYWGNNNMVQG